MQPPKPPVLAESIILRTKHHVEFDLGPVKAALLERLEEPSEEYIWARAEQLAADEIETVWSSELLEQCERGLVAAREDFLLAATRCGDALDDLEEYGRDSWIAGGIRHQLAFDASWDTLDERHGVQRFEREA